MRLVAVIVLALASGSALAQGLDGLFLQMKFAFGSLQETHYFFLPDGRYLAGVPEGGVDAAGLEKACAQPRNACGTYRAANGQITLTPHKGRAETLAFERAPDGHLKIGGLFAKHADPFPAGAKLDGTYSRIGNAGGVSAASTYVFKPDGTFSTSSLGAVTTREGTGKAQSAASGTYRLAGNVLELAAAGETRRVVAYPYDLGKGDVRLNIGGQFYKRQ